MMVLQAQIIGNIAPPPGVANWGGSAQVGLIPFLNAILNFVIVIAGLYVFLNIILAGFQYINAGGEPKEVEKAWTKIWQSLVGLLIIALSFVLAAIFGYILFKDPTALLNPKIITP
jgi:hypothetical protein